MLLITELYVYLNLKNESGASNSLVRLIFGARAFVVRFDTGARTFVVRFDTGSRTFVVRFDTGASKSDVRSIMELAVVAFVRYTIYQ